MWLVIGCISFVSPIMVTLLRPLLEVDIGSDATDKAPDDASINAAGPVRPTPPDRGGAHGAGAGRAQVRQRAVSTLATGGASAASGGADIGVAGEASAPAADADDPDSDGAEDETARLLPGRAAGPATPQAAVLAFPARASAASPQAAPAAPAVDAAARARRAQVRRRAGSAGAESAAQSRRPLLPRQGHGIN